MTVDDGDGISVGDRDVVRLDSDQLAVLLVCCIDGKVSSTLADLPPVELLVNVLGRCSKSEQAGNVHEP